jgi:hypothetical protein
MGHFPSVDRNFSACGGGGEVQENRVGESLLQTAQLQRRSTIVEDNLFSHCISVEGDGGRFLSENKGAGKDGKEELDVKSTHDNKDLKNG